MQQYSYTDISLPKTTGIYGYTDRQLSDYLYI